MSNSTPIIFIDSRVSDQQQLLSEFPADSEIIILDSQQSGLNQIADALAGRSELPAIHLIGHGSSGDLWLGNQYLSAENMADSADVLSQIGSYLSDSGDILLYGCDTGAGERGTEFVSSLAQLTQADIAASDDRTGTSGDWQLEVASGSVEAQSLVAVGYQQDLAVFTVTNRDDAGAGSLRQILADANTKDGDTITFDSALSSMSIELSTGQLLVDKDLIIDGDLDDNGTADITLDANYTSRVIEVTSGSEVTFDGLIIREGLVSGNGGISVIDANTHINGEGGGIHNQGDLTIINSTLEANYATGGGGAGNSSGGGGGSGYGNVGGGDGGNSTDDNGTIGNAGKGGKGGYGGSGAGGEGGDGIPDTDGAYGSFGGFGGLGGSVTQNGTTLEGGGGGGGDDSSRDAHDGGFAIGAIYNAGALSIYNSTVSNNSAVGGGGGGGGKLAYAGNGGFATGGIYNTAAATLNYDSNTTINNNSSDGGKKGLGRYSQFHGDNGISYTDIYSIDSNSVTSNVTRPSTADKTLDVAYNSEHILKANSFEFTDITGDSLHSITIKTLPADGDLYFNGNIISVADKAITKADLDDNKLTFKSDPNGTGTNYTSFKFTVNDGTVNSTAKTITLDIESAPPSTDSSSSSGNVKIVDGVTITTETVTEYGHSFEQIDIAPIMQKRLESNNLSANADIELHSNSEQQAITTISLPTGIGMRAYTNQTARTPQDIDSLKASLTDVAGIHPVDQMQQSVSEFYTKVTQGNSADITNLWANKITLTTTHDATVPNSPINIQGNSQVDSTEILLIDASTLLPGTVLDLNDIEFAIVFGPVSLTGGEGANIVYAGIGSQNIVLGADDDQLHGGDGDDTVGSQGGDDLIFGDAGNDTLFGGAGADTLHGGTDQDVVTYTGNMADYQIEDKRGALQITSLSDNTDSDLLVNVEKIQFADQNFTVNVDTNGEVIATLYQQILDRQADLAGFQWWMKDAEQHIPFGAIATNFLRSAEYTSKSGVVFDALSTKDQVEELYSAILGRESDSAGLAFWLDQIENKQASVEGLAGSFALSEELQNQYLQQSEWDFML